MPDSISGRSLAPIFAPKRVEPTLTSSPWTQCSIRFTPTGASGSCQRAPGSRVICQMPRCESLREPHESGAEVKAVDSVDRACITSNSTPGEGVIFGTSSPHSIRSTPGPSSIPVGRRPDLGTAPSGWAGSGRGGGTFGVHDAAARRRSHRTSPWPYRAGARGIGVVDIARDGQTTTIVEPPCGCWGKPGTTSPWTSLSVEIGEVDPIPCSFFF